MKLCYCAAVYPDRERSIVARRGCGACGGRGVVPTAITAAQRATLAAGGWREDGARWRHERYSEARVETALALAEGDEKAAKRAAVTNERTTTNG